MKKLLATALLSSIAMPMLAEQATQPITQPALVLSVYDVSNKVPRNTNSTTLSVSNKNLQLCWSALNLPLGSHADVVETITSPAGANFSAPNMNVQSFDNKTKHVISDRKALPVNAQVVESCWNFNKKDKLGAYKIQVNVNDVNFPELSFTLIK